MNLPQDAGPLMKANARGARKDWAATVPTTGMSSRYSLRVSGSVSNISRGRPLLEIALFTSEWSVLTASPCWTARDTNSSSVTHDTLVAAVRVGEVADRRKVAPPEEDAMTSDSDHHKKGLVTRKKTFSAKSTSASGWRGCCERAKLRSCSSDVQVRISVVEKS